MLGIRYKSHKHSTVSAGRGRGISRGAFKDGWDKSPPVCVFFSLSVDNMESLDNQLSLSDEYREMKIPPHLSSHCAVLNFNSCQLVFVKVICSSLLLVTSDHHRIDDASHL